MIFTYNKVRNISDTFLLFIEELNHKRDNIQLKADNRENGEMTEREKERINQLQEILSSSQNVIDCLNELAFQLED